jgi:protoporphyrinogen oxidase
MPEPAPPLYDYIVLGAGLAGLAFADQMTRAGASVLVLEKDAQSGGLSKTLNHKGFLLDYCAHRFHAANPAVMQAVQELMGDNFFPHAQRSRIFMFGRYLKYPFDIPNLLCAMPLWDSVCGGLDFIRTLFRNKWSGTPGPYAHYRAWFEHHFGACLYRVMCAPYTTKIWKHPPEQLSADWADQRFQGVNLRKLIKKTLQKLVRLDFSSYALDDEKLAPDGGVFYYPARGIQQVADRYVQRLEAQGGVLKTASAPADIDTATRQVRMPDGQIFAYAKGLVSTIPLDALYRLTGRTDARVADALAGLAYMNIVFVYLFLNKPSVSKDHWLYFPSSSIIFNRSVEFKPWSDQMAPADKTALCLDITCFADDPLWRAPDSELGQRAIAGAVQAGLIHADDVDETLVVRVEHAYPFYDLDYKRKVTNVVRFLESAGDVMCLGRTGLFRYNNADGSIEMAMELAKRLMHTPPLTPAQRSLLSYTFEHVSY